MHRHARLMALATLVLTSGGAPAGSSLYRPDSRSPLATDGQRVYAVAVDRQTIIAGDPGKADWVRVAQVPGAQIRGLAWAGGRLYFTNVADRSIQSVATAGGDKRPALVYSGSPLVQPTELTFSGALIVSDPGAGVLFRLPLDGGLTGPAGQPLPIPAELRVTDTTFITGWGDAEVIVSDSESGVLAQLTDITYDSPKFRAMQQRGPGDTPVQWNQRGDTPQTVRRQGYPGVAAPGAIAVFNGILYTIDQRSGDLFAAGVHDARAIRLPAPEPGLVPTRLLANPLWLTALDARSGRLVRWPRVVPSELTLLPAARPQSLFPVLEYLHKRRLLVTRSLQIAGDVDQTLAQARMTWPARGSPPAETLTSQGHYASFCMLNPRHCANGLPRPGLPPGTPIVLADIYAERYTAAAHIELFGTETLGEIVDAAIISEEFSALRSEEHLRRINGMRPDDPKPLREQTHGRFRYSQELVRYVIPIEASELRSDKTDFARLQDRVRETIRIAPLERVLTSRASARTPGESPGARGPHDPQHPDDPACVKARQAMKTLLGAIDFVAPAPGGAWPIVGIAEEEFDPSHPDFAAPGGGTVLLMAQPGGELAPMPPAPAHNDPAGAEPVIWREWEDTDHGTAVAALIAGRRRPFDDGEGLTRALAGLFVHRNDATALGQMIADALNLSSMAVVNLSLSSEFPAATLRIVMETQRDGVLFVIAAPNAESQVQLCQGHFERFPACHGVSPDSVNILVVGGTTLEGDRIRPGSPVGKAVHLFAPSVGYYSAGRGRGYVHVEGNSFATAIVSVAAALLVTAGVHDPAAVKNRLIATASVLEMPGRPQWARRLNIRRALSSLQRSVLVDETGQERTGAVHNLGSLIGFRKEHDNQVLPVAVEHIRRLRRVPNDPRFFELAYVAGHGLRRLEVELVKASRDPWQACFRMDEPAQAIECLDLAELRDYVGPIR